MRAAPGTLGDRILKLLEAERVALDDDQIAAKLAVDRHHVNSTCRKLAGAGLVVRERRLGGKIGNQPLNRIAHPSPPTAACEAAPIAVPQIDEAPSDWYWEGHVQARLRDHLVSQGWRLVREADCLRHERGIDLLLEGQGRSLAVEVKGFPGTTYRRGPLRGQPKPTQPTLQAKHWFAEALLAAIRIQARNPAYSVAVAFPDIPRYRRLLESTGGAFSRLGIGAYLVPERGGVGEWRADQSA